MPNSNGLIIVPEDFPSSSGFGAVSGASPKILLVRTGDGKIGVPTVSEEERIARWEYCEDIASQLANAALRSKKGKRSHMAEEEILDQYLPRLKATGWVSSQEESIWILRRVATILCWSLPESLRQ